MLILSRNEGDVIHIGDGVRIVVLSCDRKGVRLGIDAPRDVRILRGEIMVDIEQENQRAMAAQKEWLQIAPVKTIRSNTVEPKEPTEPTKG
jgi:carbon storage regulator